MKQSVISESLASRMPKGLTRQQIKEKASSMFTKKAHPDRTEAYKFVDTEVVVKHLQKLGFVAFDANQQNFRNESNPNNGFQFHGVSMYHPNLVFVNDAGVVDKVFEVVVTNSYNGYSRCSVHCSFHRLSSGMDMLAMSDDFVETIRGGTQEELAELFNLVSNHFIDMVGEIKRLKKVQLTKEQKLELAVDLGRLRHKLKENEVLGYNPEYLIEPLRDSDKSNDAWTTYCIVQEKLISGYDFPRINDGKAARKIRSVNHFELLIKINKEMFDIVREKF